MTHHNMEKTFVIFCLAAILTTLSYVPTSKGAFSAQAEVLTFLEKVFKLDVEKYGVHVVSDNLDFSEDFEGLSEENGLINLMSANGKLGVTFSFINNTLRICTVYVDVGSPVYLETPTNDVVDKARSFLENYQKITNDSALLQMREVLDMVGDNQTEVVRNGVALEVLRGNIETTFIWKNMFYGAEYSRLLVSFGTGEPGRFAFSFFDDRSYHKIGSATVNVTMEQALNIAAKRIETYSWTVTEVDGSTLRIGDFNTKGADAKLLTMGRESPLVFYPYWSVTHYLDRVYPGNVIYVVVNLWADTGEVFEVYPLGGGGGAFPEATSEPTPSPSATLIPSPIASPTAEPTPSPAPTLAQTSATPSSTLQTVDQPAGGIPMGLLAVLAVCLVAILIAGFMLRERER